jgi:hypothetical protein
MKTNMSNQILIFSDHRGDERFFLRRRATKEDLQRWLERRGIWLGSEADWISLSRIDSL